MLYPIMTPSRLVEDLAGIWDFQLDPEERGFAEKWYEKPLEDPITMPVPASFNDLKDGSDFRDYRGWVFYQRRISLPAFMEKQRVMLRFDAATHHANVYLNGRLIAEHQGGFLPFETEISDFLRPGEDNLLTVAINNFIDNTTLPVGMIGNMLGGNLGASPEPKHPGPNFDFFNYAGLNRTVRIYTTPRQYIADLTVTSQIDGEDGTRPIADGGKALLNYTVAVGGQEDQALADAALVELFDETGVKVAEANGLSGQLILEQARLWRPLNAYLYRIRVSYGEDIYELPYGIRTVRVVGNRFLINGRKFYFKGYGKHEDTFPNGRGINLAMNTRDISIMKWQGANSFRTSHYPYSEEMMRQCDREGIVVIDETTAVGINYLFGGGANFGGKKVGTFDPEHGVKTQEHHREVIRDLIARDKNHACVVLWSIANEPDSSGQGAYEYFKPLFDLARELDPQNRPVTLVSVQMAGGPDTDVSAQLSDVICLNRYYGWYFGAPDLEWSAQKMRAELDQWEKLGKPLVFTEFGADTVMGMHDTTPVMYTEEYQLDYYKMNLAVMDDYPCVTGEQVWNFADFATSQSMLRIQGNKKGLFSRDRKPKLAAHFFRDRWHAVPDFDYKE